MDVKSRTREIANALSSVEERILFACQNSGRRAEEITLIAVTKTYPSSDVEILHQLGVNDFGENRDEEGARKSEDVPANWHFQGRIQSNKIKSISRWADAVHSLDNLRHASLVNDALMPEKIMSVFIQVSLDLTPTRGGIDPRALPELAEAILILTNLKLVGLMAVAPVTEEPESAYTRLALIHNDFRRRFPGSPYLSAGMSNDFESAIAYGATHLRIGSSILGSRKSPL
jgi:pyridoxal phosphate enzyme (YggS family)